MSRKTVGILMVEVDDGFIGDTVVQYIYSSGPPKNVWGDGITIALSHASVVGSHVCQVAAAGLWNLRSYVSLTNTLLQCTFPLWSLAANDYMGQDFEFYGGGGVHCGCPNATGECIAVAPIKGPDPVETAPYQERPLIQGRRLPGPAGPSSVGLSMSCRPSRRHLGHAPLRTRR